MTPLNVPCSCRECVRRHGLFGWWVYCVMLYAHWTDSSLDHPGMFEPMGSFNTVTEVGQVEAKLF